MAISVLTDSEKKAFYDIYGTTKTKIEAVLRKSGIVEITAKTLAEVEALRKQNMEIHETTKKSGNILKSIVSIFKVAGDEAKRH